MDTSLEYKIVVGQRRIYRWTPRDRKRRGRPQKSWKNQVTHFMRSRKMEEYMAEDRHLFPFGIEWTAFGFIDLNDKKQVVSFTPNP